MRQKLLFFTLFLSIIAAGRADAGPVVGDFEGDGRSDLTVAMVDRTNSYTAFLTRLSSGADPLFYQFGLAGDALVTGRYYSDRRIYPGIVIVRDAKLPLEWYIKNPQGTDNFLQYGLPGDSVPTQNDLDCDGVTDLIVARNGRSGYYEGFKLWYVALSSTGVVQETLFGLASDRVATADLDGDSCAELLVLRNGFTWFGRKLFGHDVTQVQWGLPGDIPLLPQDLNGDERADYIVSRPTTEGGQMAYIRFDASSSTTVTLGANSSLPLLGNFNGANHFAYHERAASGVVMRQQDGTDHKFQFGIPANIVVRPDGTVVHPGDSGRLFDTPPPAAAPVDPGTPALPGNCSAPKFPDGKNGFLYKPHKEGGNHTKGGPTILGSNGIRKLVILGRDGSLVNEPRLRYYGGPGNRSVWDPTKYPSDMAGAAPLVIRSYYGNGSCEDRVVPDPRRRVD